MAAEAARQLGARAVYAEKENSALTLRRGFVLSKGEKVLILDDIVTTGGSLQETIAIAKNAKAEIIGVGVLADRSGGKVQIPGDYQPLMRVNLKVFKPETCPLCAANRPLTKPGSRRL